MHARTRNTARAATTPKADFLALLFILCSVVVAAAVAAAAAAASSWFYLSILLLLLLSILSFLHSISSLPPPSTSFS